MTDRNRLSTIETILAALASIVAIFTVGWFAVPSLTISPGVQPNHDDAFGIQFNLTNTGYLSARNVKVKCSLLTNKTALSMKHLKITSKDTFAPIPYLSGTISRGCFSEADLDPDFVLRVLVSYEWPLNLKSNVVNSYFSVRKGESGTFLVPDITPPTDFKEVIRIQ